MAGVDIQKLARGLFHSYPRGNVKINFCKMAFSTIQLVARKNLEVQFEITKLLRKALTDRRGTTPIDSKSLLAQAIIDTKALIDTK